MNRLFSLLVLMLLLPATATAQASAENAGAPAIPASSDTATPKTGSDLDPAVAARVERYKAAQAVREADGDDTKGQPASPPASVAFTAETAAAYQKAWQAYYAYRADGYTHRQRVFEWQDVSTKIIFGVVIVLVLAGVYFAAVQFHAGLRERQLPPEASEVELSAKGIKVRSPVLGVIVLTISLAFFYLYLIYVYPVETVF